MCPPNLSLPKILVSSGHILKQSSFLIDFLDLCICATFSVILVGIFALFISASDKMLSGLLICSFGLVLEISSRIGFTSMFLLIRVTLFTKQW